MSGQAVIADAIRIEAEQDLIAAYDAESVTARILSALAAAGYAVVPVEPTTGMLQDGQMAGRKARRPAVSGMTIDTQVRAECAVEAAIYRAMLAAAGETKE
jgi:hypothetical protein